MKNRQLWATAVIVAAGIAIGFAILGLERDDGGAHDHGEERKTEGSTAKGPHGGRLLVQDDFAIEIAIVERGVPPRMHAYAFEKSKPIPPGDVKLEVGLERLGAAREEISFEPREGYLRGDRDIAEPHSFTVTVVAERAAKTYRWAYQQEEGRVRMTDVGAKSAGIEIAAAGPATIRSLLQLQGEIQFNRDRVAHVVPRLAGVVVRSGKNLGDAVK